MCRLVIVQSGLRLRRMWNGYVKRTECLSLNSILLITFSFLDAFAKLRKAQFDI